MQIREEKEGREINGEGVRRKIASCKKRHRRNKLQGWM